MKIQNRIIESMGAKIVDHDLNIYIECDSCIKDLRTPQKNITPS